MDSDASADNEVDIREAMDSSNGGEGEYEGSSDYSAETDFQEGSYEQSNEEESESEEEEAPISKRLRRRYQPIPLHVQDSSSSYSGTGSYPKNSLTMALKTTHRRKHLNCIPEDQDDEEDLTQARKSSVKAESSANPPGPGVQQVTPAYPQAESALGSPYTAPAIPQNRSTRFENTPLNGSRPQPTASGAATTLSSLSSLKRQRSRPINQQVIVDLTDGPDEDSREIKQGTSGPEFPTPEAYNRPAPLGEESEDEEDLEDQLREVQLRRKLRAKRKKKLAGGKVRP